MTAPKVPQKRVVAVIPVRGGSKGLPGKNTRLLCGKPLLAWSIEAALACPKIESVWVTSDDETALRMATEYGARAYRRPPHLANDTAPMAPVIADFARHLESLGDPPDAVMVMYATHPLRTAADVEETYDTFCASGGRPLIGVKKSHTHPYLYYKLDADNHPVTFCGIDPNQFYRRQDYPVAYELTTFACVIPLSEMGNLNAQLQTPTTVAMFVEPKKTHDIDSLEDFEIAELIIQKRTAKEQDRAGHAAAE
jgi:CMP-N,N'-diacetyllegionaminic acid synthase